MRLTKIVASCLIPIVIPLFASETSVEFNTYSHAAMVHFQGIDGTGRRLLLRQKKTCEGRQPYPRLEIDIRERRVPIHRSIIIGPENGAFRCLSLKESCEQALSGEVVFEHFEHPRTGKTNETDGNYDLKFRGGSERGRFEVDCFL
jgi:hypothetical protein